jgi:hypothetical protein
MADSQGLAALYGFVFELAAQPRIPVQDYSPDTLLLASV